MRRAGIVGCGAIARKHVRAMSGCDCGLVAVCDRNIDVARVFAEAFTGVAAYDSMGAMISGASLDTIHITTPPLTHRDLTVQSLLAGCDVLVEKPVALNIEELQSIEEAALRSGRRFSTVHNILFEPAFRTARTSIVAGEIGEVVSVHITDRIPAHEKALSIAGHWCHGLPAGMFGEMMAHPLYAAAALLGTTLVRDVHVSKVGPGELPVFDEMCVYLDAEQGMGSISLSLNAMREEFRIDVLGTKQTLVVDVTQGLVSRIAPVESGSAMERGTANVRKALSILSQTGIAAVRKSVGRRAGGHDVLVVDFYDRLEDGRPFAVTSRDVREATRLFEGVVARLPA